MSQQARNILDSILASARNFFWKQNAILATSVHICCSLLVNLNVAMGGVLLQRRA